MNQTASVSHHIKCQPSKTIKVGPRFSFSSLLLRRCIYPFSSNMGIGMAGHWQGRCLVGLSLNWRWIRVVFGSFAYVRRIERVVCTKWLFWLDDWLFWLRIYQRCISETKFREPLEEFLICVSFSRWNWCRICNCWKHMILNCIQTLLQRFIVIWVWNFSFFLKKSASFIWALNW